MQQLIRLAKPQADIAGLVAHYKLWAGPTSVNKVFDYSLNGNEGTISGATPAYPGFLFDGADSNISVSPDSSIDSNNKTTLTGCMWINPASDGEGNSGRIVDKSSLGYRFFSLGALSGKVAVESQIGHATQGSVARSAAINPLNIWSFVAFTYNEDGDKKTKLYRNAVLLSLIVDIAGTGATKDDSGATLFIGNAFSSVATFDGLIDDVMIFDTAKSIAGLKNIYEATRGRYGV